MPDSTPLSLLFLWHQHQPLYKDPLSNRYEMPWVRLHATKDYFDMAAILDEFPRIRVNINLVPSLLLQLDDYAQGKAHDKFLALSLKPAVELSFEEKLFILHNFFMANWDNMIDPYPRYRELLIKRGRTAGGEDMSRALNYFKEQDWRDLQVWFNLAWFDPYWREHDDLIRQLFQKGKGYTEDDKKALVDKQMEVCRKVVAKHKELADKGQIEITTTPFYHPILPLLCDTDAAKMAMPQATLPSQPFVHPEDARLQIQRAIEDYTRRFGVPPKGMWPSEGSVSETVARFFTDLGIQWVATDEAILALSLGTERFKREDIYEPYRLMVNGQPLHFFFRDHELSDAIGFVYTSWDYKDAVNDFMGRLYGIRDRLIERDGGTLQPHIVPIILDGENCWEYYKEDGVPFLRELYGRLSSDPLFKTVRGSDYLAQAPASRTLERLWSGSWINANFAIWIGHGEDNRAWDLLLRTRQFLVDYLKNHPEMAQNPQVSMAWEEIYIAEGSDWCWWYGDDHSSANDATFDYLFRKHLMNVYSILGCPIPEDLHIAIKGKQVRQSVKPPLDFITPRIDGKVTSYFEWQSAGVYMTEAGSTGTMHRAQNLVKDLYYGFDLYHLYFRLDLSRPVEDEQVKAALFKVIFLKPDGLELHFQVSQKGPFTGTWKSNKNQNQADNQPPVEGSAHKIIELAIPLSSLGSSQDSFECVISIEQNGNEQERWPLNSIIAIPYPSEETFAQSWVI